MESLFLPVKSLNELRRSALRFWKRSFFAGAVGVCRDGNDEKPEESSKRKQTPEKMPCFYVSCEEKETAKRFLLEESGVTGIYVPADAMEGVSHQQIPEGAVSADPAYHKRKDSEGFETQVRKWLSRGMKGFLVRNLETYGALKRLGFAQLCVADHSLYTWNNEAVNFWKKEGILRNTAPLELNEKELLHRDNEDSELLVYGYLP